MVDVDVIREGFAAALRAGAARRRRSAAGRPTGEDLKIIALFERLEAEALALDHDACRLVLACEDAAGPFHGRCEVLFAQLGIIYVPRDAADLVRWMSRQSPDSLDRQDVVQRRHIPIRPAPDRGVATEPPTSLRTAVASDFCAGFGIVAPMLAVWEIGQASGQWRDRAKADAGPVVQASVLSTKSIGGDRGNVSSVVLSFEPAHGSATCQVAVHVGPGAVHPEPGATMTVVPRSSDCEPPLIPSDIGNPIITFALAAALLAGGLVALKLWGTLARRQRSTFLGPTPERVWSRRGAAI